MKNKIFSLIVAVFALFAFVENAGAQQATTFTFLKSAVTGPQTNVFLVGSTTGMTGAQRGIYIDREYMLIRSVDTTNNLVTVSRGTGGMESNHLVNSVVWVGPAGNGGPFYSTDGVPSYPAPGPCVRTALAYLPVVNVDNGNVWDCPAIFTAANASGNGHGNEASYATPYNWQKAMDGGVPTDNLYKPVLDAAFTMRHIDYYVDYISMTAARTTTLPSVTTTFGKKVIVKNSSNGQTLTIQGANGQYLGTIGTFSTTLNSGGILRLMATGGGWETW